MVEARCDGLGAGELRLRCASVEDALEKLQYDLFYAKNPTLPFDSLIVPDGQDGAAASGCVLNTHAHLSGMMPANRTLRYRTRRLWSDRRCLSRRARKILTADIVATCDSYRDLAEQAAARFDVPAYFDSMDEMFRQTRPDVVRHHDAAPYA